MSGSFDHTIFKKFDVTRGVSYGGFCYDGPLEGKWRREISPMFTCRHFQRTGYAYSLDSVAGDIHDIYYRWSDPLKAWVVLNMR